MLCYKQVFKGDCTDRGAGQPVSMVSRAHTTTIAGDVMFYTMTFLTTANIYRTLVAVQVRLARITGNEGLQESQEVTQRSAPNPTMAIGSTGLQDAMLRVELQPGKRNDDRSEIDFLGVVQFLSNLIDIYYTPAERFKKWSSR